MLTRELMWSIVAGIVLMFVLPELRNLDITLFGYHYRGPDYFALTLISIFGILALSLGFVWGYAGILCFGQAAFYGLGGYAYAITVINTEMTWLGFLAAIIVPAIVAAVLGAMMFYGRLSDVYMAVVTLVFTLLLFKFMNTTAGEGYRIGAARLGGYNGIPGYDTLSNPFHPSDSLYEDTLYYLCAILLLVIYVGVRLILRSPFGRILIGIRENELRAELMGYDVRLLKTLAFTIGGAIAGIAGCLYANYAEIITPTMFSLGQSSDIIIWTITGGAGTLAGPILGAGILGYLKILLGENSGLNNFVIMGVVLVLAVLFLPRGLAPELVALWRRLTRSRTRSPRRMARRRHAT
jgi:branched-chain amino acid transport system permease protein